MSVPPPATGGRDRHGPDYAEDTESVLRSVLGLSDYRKIELTESAIAEP
jgi:hypothetical protein